MPVPSFVSVPEVDVLMPDVERVVAPEPPTVRANPLPVIPPVRVKVPESELIRDAEPSVIAPDQELLPETLRRAPADEIPVPFKVNASAPTEIPPCSSSAAPVETVTPPAVVPVAVAFWRFNTPAETVVAPV